MFECFNNSTIVVNGIAYNCDSQPDDRHRGNSVKRIFFEPNFEIVESMIVLLNNEKYEIIEANNYSNYCEIYIKKYVE